MRIQGIQKPSCQNAIFLFKTERVCARRRNSWPCISTQFLYLGNPCALDICSRLEGKPDPRFVKFILRIHLVSAKRRQEQADLWGKPSHQWKQRGDSRKRNAQFFLTRKYLSSVWIDNGYFDARTGPYCYPNNRWLFSTQIPRLWGLQLESHSSSPRIRRELTLFCLDPSKVWVVEY